MLITSVNNSRIKDIVKLKDKKYRDKNKLFYIEGLDIIEEAYKNKLLKQLYVLDGYDNIYNDIECFYISSEVMKKISDMDSITPYFGICNMIQEKEIGDRIIILDNLQDPGNLGTIIRSSVAFNFDTVVLSEDTVNLYNPKVIRSTKGMIFNTNIIVRDIVDFINKLDGYMVYGTNVNNGVNIRNENINGKIAIVIGNEGNGVSDSVIKLCNKNIYIDVDKKCESLNAGVAASILMYEVDKK